MDVTKFKADLKNEVIGLSAILQSCKELDKLKKQIKDVDELINFYVKTYMKERGWDTYKDKESDVSISIAHVKKEDINMKLLQMILSEGQYAQIVTTKSFEKLNIVTPAARKKMGKFVI